MINEEKFDVIVESIKLAIEKHDEFIAHAHHLLAVQGLGLNEAWGVTLKYRTGDKTGTITWFDEDDTMSSMDIPKRMAQKLQEIDFSSAS